MTELQKVLIEQYKAYLQDLGNIGARIESNKQFMLSILSALFVVLSLGGKDGPLLKVAPGLTFVILGVAILICVAWFLKTRTYELILRAKFKVLQDLERALPFRCFETEWKYFMDKKPIYLTTIDSLIPWFLIAAFVLLGILRS